MQHHITSASILTTSFFLLLGACGGGDDAGSGPAAIGTTGAVVDLPKNGYLQKPTAAGSDEWHVTGHFAGFTFINLEPGKTMPSAYDQERMVAESNIPEIAQHGVMTRGADGLVIFTHESSNGSDDPAARSLVVESWLPEAEAGKATYCYANSNQNDQTAFDVCRSLRKKGTKLAAAAAPAASASGELPVTNMMMDPRIVEPCVQECASSGEPPGDLSQFDSSPYGMCFNGCKQRLADEINARVSGR